MSVGKFLKNAGWAAIAAAFVASVVPAEAHAQSRSRAERMQQHREGGPRADAGQRSRMEARGQRVRAASERRTQRADTSRQRPPQTQQVRQADRRATPPPRPVVNTTQNRPVERNRTYADRDRNGSYVAQNNNRRGNDRNGTWRGNRQANDRNAGWRNDRRDNDRNRNWRNDRRDNDRNRNWRNDRRDNDRWRGDHRRWDRNWRNDRRYDWHRYRNSNRVVFRIGTYHAPYRNYAYRRLGIGAFLNSLFYSSSYWINDPWQYRLPAVYGPYRWVRYYNDVLLVDIYTGEVVDVIHDFFW